MFSLSNLNLTEATMREMVVFERILRDLSLGAVGKRSRILNVRARS